MINGIFYSKKFQVIFSILFLFIIFSLSAQNLVSVPLGHRVYYFIEQAETRGLCSALPAVKPYTRAQILEILDEVLSSKQGRFGSLKDNERKIIEEIRLEFVKEEAGLHIYKGLYQYDVKSKKGDTRFSGQIGVAAESLNSAAIKEDDFYFGTDTWGTFYVNGDIGHKLSFNVDFSVGLLRAQTSELGKYNTYASQMEYEEDRPANINKEITTHSQPHAFFPYTYQKRWDGYMFNLMGEMSSGTMEGWPQELVIAPSMTAEMTGTLFDDMLLLRAGRMKREWGAMTHGSSLSFNAQARPFFGLELNFTPVPAFSFSSLTGVLEFDNREGISEPAKIFQNAFSIAQVDINIKNYFHVSLGSNSVWSKRFELGYLFPLLDNFYYQNYIGDFDNMAVFLNLKGQYPGLGKLWFSFFMDEIEISSMDKIFELDRHMFSYQAGLQAPIPGLPFTSITASYTKVEPYTYTHTREKTPWYDDIEEAYVNNGVCLGYYLPPNSDEIKIKFDIQPLERLSFFFQYQLIRHGADFGYQQVDGSSLLSELDKSGRGGEKISLHKDFLNDGAYQWMHIAKIGAQYKFGKLPLTIFGETGIVNTYFTTIDQDKYDGLNPPPENSQTPESTIERNTPTGNYFEYTKFILTIGFRIFK